MRRSALALVGTLALASAAQAAPIGVDFNVTSTWTAPSSGTQAGYIAANLGAHGGTTTFSQAITTASFDSDFTVALSSVQLRDRGAQANNDGRGTLAGTLAALVGDAARQNNGGSIVLTFTNLDAGVYTITTYHHDAYDANDPNINISVTHGLTTGSRVANAAQSSGLNADAANVANYTFSFSPDASGTAAITFAAGTGGGTGSEVYLNGFNLIPEPASVGLLAAGGALMLGRRRA